MNPCVNQIQKAITTLALTGSFALLASCAATSTVIEHRNLETDTKLSQTIFLDPVAQSQKTIYITVKNTSQESLTIDKSLKKSLEEHGYKVVGNPAKAHYMLQANILKVGKMSVSASQSALGGGYGSALAGAATGTALGALSGHSSTMIGAGIGGGIIGLAADSLVKAVNYTMITDVQISERVGKGAVHEQFNSNLQNGTASGTTQTSSKHSDYQRYRTRVVSNADKVNLSFAQARPALEQGLVKTLAGIF
ncbi:TPA: conjugal transfer protein TraT [Legionella pneumophila]|uniref:Lipoprotein YlpA n=1 Tax=Legionella bozemanae TaxID=447 RepID=A0A0W0RBG5_LEGBO|nr:complement resistance protein TraT [Legionella bozemanae]KTC68399.1 Lipoprotein YlpA precursor [Legionella bozemanae]STP10124.1 conjugal transfer surface exclusion protein TraT [Legionella bozemanae]HAT1722244.1 conjugal transfer protein TraT [Legionella pneumophila]